MCAICAARKVQNGIVGLVFEENARKSRVQEQVIDAAVELGGKGQSGMKSGKLPPEDSDGFPAISMIRLD